MTEIEAKNLKLQYRQQLLALEEVSGVGITLEYNNYFLIIFLIEETPNINLKLSKILNKNKFKTKITGPLKSQKAHV